MFPSSGYFRSISCPYYASGLCERPNCHYRHVKSVEETSHVVVGDSSPWNAGTDEDSGGGSDKPYLLRLVREAVLQVQKEVEADKLKLQVDDSDVAQRESDKRESQATVGDEDIEMRDSLLDDAVVVGSESKHGSKQTKAPEYTPTPIAKLKLRQMKQHLQQQTQLNLQKASAPSSLEYDPTESCSKANKSTLVFDYKPSPKVNSNKDAAITKETKFMKKGSTSCFVEENEDSDDYQPADNDVAFSDDEEDANSSCKHLKDDETKQEGNTNLNFDIVNRILTESKMCDTLITAASLKKETQTKLSTKSDANKPSVSKKSSQNGAKSSKPKTPTVKVSNNSKTPSKTSTNSRSSSNSLKESINSKKKDKIVDNKNVSSKNKITSSKKSSDNKIDTKTLVQKTDANSKHKLTPKTSVISPKKKSLPVKKIKSPPQLNLKSNGVSPIKQPNPMGLLVDSGLTTTASSQEDFSDLDDLDEHDTYEECLKIFNEYVPEQSENTVSKRTEHKTEEKTDFLQTAGKKRVAHEGAGTGTPVGLKRQKLGAIHQPTPSMIMQNRLLQSLQTFKENQALSQADLMGSKRRIAHTPTVVKQTTIPSFAGPSTSQISKPTLAQTATKGGSRVAHMPTKTSLQRPMIAAEFGCRVPINIRQRYLNMIIDECLTIYTSEQDAFDRAVNEEKSAYDRSSNRTIYLNSVAITIKKLRSEKSGQLPLKSPPRQGATSHPIVNNNKFFGKGTSKSLVKPPPQRIVSHEAILYGKKGGNLTVGVQKKKFKPYEEPLTGAKLYTCLQSYLLTEEQLEINGYPMSHPTDSSRAIIHKRETKKVNKSYNPLEKTCARCGKSFEISPEGIYITKANCFYHPGRLYKKRIAGGIDSNYSCCQERIGQSDGCQIADLHVLDEVDYDNLKGFVKTMYKSPPRDGNCGVFALDCEMSYTTKGMELVRVTVIGQDLKPVYETLIKPDNPIVDYNTRFSGISKEDMEGVNISLRDVQAALLARFNAQTILIGHSLESDLKALKLIHRTVVDTSIVFPHRLGSPYKRALRNLSAELLGKVIQNEVGGHDSQEDAAACMELMFYKIREDMKKLC
ncbi:RNA exonuclease 1 [Chamberlinius hualienensis]